ncbi:MAG: cysteine--tRNA ligase [Candidatus Micrarchaeota archaeon]|nr:cysteine--tRNA ligase [Candidatus Micrarchaeota archaeon]MCX8154495.1 cysteine--tRNA ligase [Candidatus Micrarchaeota archaeon]
MKLYDTYDKTLREFSPLSPPRVIMYVCGLTPYDDAHLGHARTYVAFDVLKRYLIYRGYRVFHIQNITDIDDKLIARGEELKRDPLEIAEYYHSRALESFMELNIIPADVYPKVSDHIHEIERIVKSLLDTGYAYRTSTGIYFDISKFSRYGKLSNQSLDQINRHRIEPDPTKRNPSDFALWKYTQDYTWDSHLGKGRPGWHIECSAMALKYSQGNIIDIHGGARDLIFPHHENEIAQSECYTNRKFVNFWIHTGFLTVNGEKMSKSLKNFITIRDLLSREDAMVLRMLLVSSKYSSPLDYSDTLLAQARENYMKLKEFYSRVSNAKGPISDQENLRIIDTETTRFFEEMDNDLNTPGALSALFNIISHFNTHEIDLKSAMILKKFLNDVSFILGIKIESDLRGKMDMLLRGLGDYRKELRSEKKYKESDRLREIIERAGVKVYDRDRDSEYIY